MLKNLSIRVASMLLALSAPAALRGQATWDGGAGTSNWSDANNWLADVVPGEVALTFNAAAASNQYTIFLGGNRSATGVTFVPAGGVNSFVFDGSILTLGSGGILNQDTETQRFDSTIATSANQTWNSGSGVLLFNHVALHHTLTLAGSGAIGISGTLTLDDNRTVTNDSGSTVTLTNVTMPADRTLTVTGTGNTDITGIIDAGAITKQGSGTVILRSANTYTGATSISGGTLVATHSNALGTGATGTTVTSGGTLALEGGITVTGESLSITGAGANGAGALRNNSDTNIWNGSVTLGGNASVVAAGGTLVIGQNPGPGLPQPQTVNLGGNTLTVDTSGGDVRVESNLAGLGGSLVKTGSGTLSLGGLANNHTGSTTVQDGTLRLFTVHEPATGLANVGLLGAVVIGDNVGAEHSASLVYGLVGDASVSGHRIRDNATVRINRDGLLDTSGSSEVVGAITFQGGDIMTGGGMLGITNNITALASDREASIAGPGSLHLGDVVRTITTAEGASLRVEAAVTDGGLFKTGGGHLALSGNNTYRLETHIERGTVTIRSDTALGSTIGGTTIGPHGSLQVENNLTSAERITVQGMGISNAGAIRNLSGDNTLSGAITLAGMTRINSDAGQLTFTNNLTGAGHSLTVGGTGDTRVNGVIATGSGTLTKDGAGTLTLGGVNTFTGLTTVSGGTLSFATTQVLGVNNVIHTASGTIVDLNGFNQSIGMVTGTGSIIFDGAQLTLNGAGTFGGSFDGSGTLVLAAGSSLTLGADFNSANLDIVLAGGALYLNNFDSTFRSLTVTGDSILDFGSGHSIIEFTSGVLANAQLQVKNWVDTIDYFYSTLNAGVQGTAPLNNIVFDGFTGNDTRWLPYTDGPYNNHQITPVPEPRVYGACFIGAALSLVGWHRRRQNALRADVTGKG